MINEHALKEINIIVSFNKELTSELGTGIFVKIGKRGGININSFKVSEDDLSTLDKTIRNFACDYVRNLLISLNDSVLDKINVSKTFKAKLIRIRNLLNGLIVSEVGDISISRTMLSGGAFNIKTPIKLTDKFGPNDQFWVINNILKPAFNLAWNTQMVPYFKDRICVLKTRL